MDLDLYDYLRQFERRLSTEYHNIIKDIVNNRSNLIIDYEQVDNQYEPDEFKIIIELHDTCIQRTVFKFIINSKYKVPGDYTITMYATFYELVIDETIVYEGPNTDIRKDSIRNKIQRYLDTYYAKLYERELVKAIRLIEKS